MTRSPFAGYPIAVRYVDPRTLKLAKGAILFISDDKIHDFEQVQKFERRALEIFEEKCGQLFTCWNRWSDNCAALFKSKKSLGRLMLGTPPQRTARLLGTFWRPMRPKMRVIPLEDFVKML